MSELTDFLLRMIAEDEAAARAAIADDEGADEGFANQYDRLVGTHDRPLDFVPRFAEDAARLIVRFAVPARVLAECAARRRIVDLCAQSASYIFDDDPDDPIEWSAEVHMAADTLRALASVYADAPGFREEWL